MWTLKRNEHSIEQGLCTAELWGMMLNIEIIKMLLINLHLEELLKPLEAWTVFYTNRGGKDLHFWREMTSDKQTNSKKWGKSRLLFRQNMKSTQNSKS